MADPNRLSVQWTCNITLNRIMLMLTLAAQCLIISVGGPSVCLSIDGSSQSVCGL